jgi:hypothetical protein
MITMRGLSRQLAEVLDSDATFKALSTTLIGQEFNYFVNVDLSTVEVPIPYFGIVTFNDRDEKEVKKSFQTQLLLGIGRPSPVKINNITEEPSLDILEQLSRAALVAIETERRNFGIQGDKNIKIAYINMYVPSPDGEDDLQMQIDIEFEQEKFLSC